jgi:hypothetical protein
MEAGQVKQFDKPNKGSELPLEKRAVAALTEDTNSAAMAALITELTPAIIEARQASAVEEERALDPRKSPDLKAAREQRDDALLLVGRLETLQSQLQRRHSAARAQEEVATYEAKRDELQAESDGIEQALRETYCDAAQRIFDVFERAKAFQARASRVLGYPPPGVQTLSKFDNSVERVMDKVTLIDFQDTQHWPPPQASLGVAFVEGITFPSHSAGVGGVVGPGWETEEVRQKFRARHEQEQERQKAIYAEMAKEQTDRGNAEERERFLAARRSS